jgi:hypothetical protein
MDLDGPVLPSISSDTVLVYPSLFGSEVILGESWHPPLNSLHHATRYQYDRSRFMYHDFVECFFSVIGRRTRSHAACDQTRQVLRRCRHIADHCLYVHTLPYGNYTEQYSLLRSKITCKVDSIRVYQNTRRKPAIKRRLCRSILRKSLQSQRYENPRRPLDIQAVVFIGNFLSRCINIANFDTDYSVRLHNVFD